VKVKLVHGEGGGVEISTKVLNWVPRIKPWVKPKQWYHKHKFSKKEKNNNEEKINHQIIFTTSHYFSLFVPLFPWMDGWTRKLLSFFCVV
jgi:hypothetical protein